MNTVVRYQRECPLPAQVANMCETGCIYREPTFKHASCPKISKFSVCAAPCPPETCDCKHLLKTDPCNPKIHTLRLQ